MRATSKDLRALLGAATVTRHGNCQQGDIDGPCRCAWCTMARETLLLNIGEMLMDDPTAVDALEAVERLGQARKHGDVWGYDEDEANTAVCALADRLATDGERHA